MPSPIHSNQRDIVLHYKETNYAVNQEFVRQLDVKTHLLPLGYECEPQAQSSHNNLGGRIGLRTSADSKAVWSIYKLTPTG